jgi:hypothetical protein
MMKIVVPLPERHKRRDEVVSRRVLIIECAFTQPMSQRVDRESGLQNFTSVNSASGDVWVHHYVMNCENPKKTGVEVSPTPVTPKVSRNRSGDENSPDQRDRKIISILPLHNNVLA